MREGVKVRISFGADPPSRRRQSSPIDRRVEFLDVDVDLGHDERDESTIESIISDGEISVQSDEDDMDESESTPDIDNEAPKAPPVESVSTLELLAR